MPGFSRDDQSLLALLALGHQGKLTKLTDRAPTRDQWLTLLCLRLAVLLSRRREDHSQLPLQVTAENCRIVINTDKAWLAAHALSEYSLQRERQEWAKAGFDVELHATTSTLQNSMA